MRLSLIQDLFLRVVIIVVAVNAIGLLSLSLKRVPLTPNFVIMTTALMLIIISISFAFDWWRYPHKV